MRQGAIGVLCCGILALSACAQEVAPRVEVRTGDAVSQARARAAANPSAATC
jgi:hypothetical protein